MQSKKYKNSEKLLKFWVERRKARPASQAARKMQKMFQRLICYKLLDLRGKSPSSTRKNLDLWWEIQGNLGLAIRHRRETGRVIFCQSRGCLCFLGLRACSLKSLGSITSILRAWVQKWGRGRGGARCRLWCTNLKCMRAVNSKLQQMWSRINLMTASSAWLWMSVRSGTISLLVTGSSHYL